MPDATGVSTSDAVDALVAVVLGPSGVSDPEWRRSAYERGRAITRGATAMEASSVGSLPDLLARLVDAVARAAHRITDAHFECLYAAGHSAEVLYELTIAAALGTGVERRIIGLEAIEAWEASGDARHGESR